MYQIYFMWFGSFDAIDTRYKVIGGVACYIECLEFIICTVMLVLYHFNDLGSIFKDFQYFLFRKIRCVLNVYFFQHLQSYVVTLPKCRI